MDFKWLCALAGGEEKKTKNKHTKWANTHTFVVVFFHHSTVCPKDDKTATTLRKQLQVCFKAATYSRLDLDIHDSFRAKHTHVTLTEHERNPRKTININQRKYNVITKEKGGGLCRVSWFRRKLSLKAESLSGWLCFTAIGSPTSPEKETVLDCRSRCAPALPWWRWVCTAAAFSPNTHTQTDRQ